MNIYKEARLEASKKKKCFESQDYAAKELGTTSSTLCRYETDYSASGAPAETVVAMSLLYGDPGLRRKHCNTYCPLGKYECPNATQRDMTVLGYMACTITENIKKLEDTYKEYMKDGKLNNAEIISLINQLPGLYESSSLIREIINSIEIIKSKEMGI